jgi:nucleotide-binding universal stress UspA family protein
VRAEVRRAMDARSDVGSLLLAQARELNAGMLVMGAYHHSRLREFILGGPTRTVLEQMTIPVFMSH